MKIKIILVILCMFAASAFIISNTDMSKHKSKTNLDIGTSDSPIHNKVSGHFQKDSSKSVTNNKTAVNCKTCHTGEYPTKNNPLLVPCPREGMISVYHKPQEGPEIVLLNQVANRYEPVVFSHKLHAQMAEMGSSCNGCHHYNTTGPVLPCRKCHESERKREDVSKPDLRAAYHRQCMNCHRKWNHITGCNNTCHFPKDEKTKLKIENELAKIRGKEHPPLTIPVKLTYETSYNKGKIVTFFHDEHINLFKIQCVACHQENSCLKCHDKEHLYKNNNPDFVKPIKEKKTLDEHHKPCFGCHADENNKAFCKKCHQQEVMQPFDHQRATGWRLNRFHLVLPCQKCHGNSTPYKKLNNECESCHKNLKNRKFDHLIVGLVLSENHKDLECENCHSQNKFSISPECLSCHEDKSWPKDKPGKTLALRKKMK